MSNLKIVSGNLAIDATLTASSEAGSLVVENLQTDSKTEVCRSVGTNQQITATFTSGAVGCVSLPITNLSDNATMRVRCYTMSGDSVPVLDTGAVSCCAYTTIDKIDFAAGPLNANTFSYGGGTYATLFFTEQTAEKVVIDLADAGNPAGYIDLTYLVVGAAWSPVTNADYGAELSFNDTSRHSRNDSGDMMTDRGARYKKLAFTLGNMASADRIAATEMLIRNGLSVPLFISLFPGSVDEQERQVYQCYGKLTRLSSINRYRYGADKNSIEMEEM